MDFIIKSSNHQSCVILKDNLPVELPLAQQLLKLETSKTYRYPTREHTYCGTYINIMTLFLGVGKHASWCTIIKNWIFWRVDWMQQLCTIGFLKNTFSLWKSKSFENHDSLYDNSFNTEKYTIWTIKSLVLGSTCTTGVA